VQDYRQRRRLRDAGDFFEADCSGLGRDCFGDQVDRRCLDTEATDPGYELTGTTAVRIVIIAYSKGATSTRLYLKSLDQPLTDLPPDFLALPADENGLVPPPAFNPVSEFVAVSLDSIPKGDIAQR